MDSHSHTHSLTDRQHQQLDRIADRDPGAKVVAWYDSPENQGPVIRGSDGRTHAVSTGRLVEVVGIETPRGRAIRQQELQQLPG